ncbi:hypothetical protein PUN28_009660 [Cardiocondyla obscurior]|uniref:Uncharacterized protein n=1 Tax=Cardiocondyla obscurior TaxID=286306 RepID=A0AAW2FVA9_9HYME
MLRLIPQSSRCDNKESKNYERTAFNSGRVKRALIRERKSACIRLRKLHRRCRSKRGCCPISRMTRIFAPDDIEVEMEVEAAAAAGGGGGGRDSGDSDGFESRLPRLFRRRLRFLRELSFAECLVYNRRENPSTALWG